MVSRVKGSSFKREDDREKLKKEEGDFRKETKNPAKTLCD